MIKKIALALALISMTPSIASARPSSSSSFSRSYSAPSSSRSYMSSRSTPSYTPRSYSYSRPSSGSYGGGYSSSRSYSSGTTNNYYHTPSPRYYGGGGTTVIHEHTHSGGGFGSSFLGGAAGAIVGNSLMNSGHRDGGWDNYQNNGPVYSGSGPAAAPSGPTEGPDSFAQNQTYEVTRTQSSGSSVFAVVFLLFILGFLIFGAVFLYRKIRGPKNKSIYTKPNMSLSQKIGKNESLFKNNPDLVVDIKVNLPVELGTEVEDRLFVMDNVGLQSVSAIGKNEAFAHLYLGGVIDEDFVRVFLSTSEGGAPREAWAFSNITSFYGNDILDLDSLKTMNFDDRVWTCYVPGAMNGEETIVDNNGNKTTRRYSDYMFARQAKFGLEYLYIRDLAWVDADGTHARAQRVYCGVEVPVTCIA